MLEPAPAAPSHSPTPFDSSNDTNYVSDDENEPAPTSKDYESSEKEDDWDMDNLNTAPSPHIRRSKRVMQQLRDNEKDGLHRIAALAAKETALPPGLLMRNSKYSSGYGNANKNLQMEEWAYKEYFAAAIINASTGEPMKYRDLMKKPDLRELWQRSLANELGRLAQGIRDIKGTNTIYFIPKSDIPHDRRK